MSGPQFNGLPRCWRHFFRGHKWWCRACDRVTEDEFREVCEALWAIKSRKLGVDR